MLTYCLTGWIVALRLMALPSPEPGAGSSPSIPPRVPLRRTHDLLGSFLENGGTLRSAQGSIRETLERFEHLESHPLPWVRSAEQQAHARLIVWRGDTTFDDESMRSLVLWDGDSWCSEKLSLGQGARLRLQPLLMERSRHRRPESMLEIVFHTPARKGERASQRFSPETPKSLNATSQ